MKTKNSLNPYLENKKLNKIEQQKAFKDGLLIRDEIEKFARIGWDEIDKTDLELRLKWLGIFWRPKTPGKFMLRLRIPNGIITSNQLEVISFIIARYGEEESCDITTRQNLQLRGILISDLPEILKRLDEAEINTIQSGFDNPRNVTGNPLAGIDPKEKIDTRKYTKILEDFLTKNGSGNDQFSNLPRKWNTAVAGSEENFLLHNDLIFQPIELDGVMGFGIWVGGILSSQLNDYAIPLNAWIEPENICKITNIILKIWRDNGERSIRAKGRFRFFINKIGLDKFRAMVEKEFGRLQKDPGSKVSESPKSFFGFHEQKQKGIYYAGIHIPVGRLRSDDLLDLSEISKEYGSNEIRLTEDQNIIIPGINRERIEDLQNNQLFNRFTLNPSAIAAGTVSCTGNKYCNFAQTNTKDTALKISKELDQEINLPEEVKIHWTGCPNSCGQAYMGTIGLTGKKTRNSNGELVEAYDISVGGSQGEENTIGKLEYKSIPIENLKSILKDILTEKYSASQK